MVEDRLYDLKLSRLADHKIWRFLLLRAEERHQHAGFAMGCRLATKSDHRYVEYANAGLSDLRIYAINTGRHSSSDS